MTHIVFIQWGIWETRLNIQHHHKGLLINIMGVLDLLSIPFLMEGGFYLQEGAETSNRSGWPQIFILTQWH